MFMFVGRAPCARPLSRARRATYRLDAAGPEAQPYRWAGRDIVSFADAGVELVYVGMVRVNGAQGLQERSGLFAPAELNIRLDLP